MTIRHDAIVKELRSQGHRITKVRSAMIEVFFRARSPFLAGELKALLQKKGIDANKTTIYREIDFLMEQGIIREVEFGDRQKRYELVSGPHHHHTVCIRCKRIDDIELPNDLQAQELKIAQKKNFKVQYHSLEFFGLCAACQKHSK